MRAEDKIDMYVDYNVGICVLCRQNLHRLTKKYFQKGGRTQVLDPPLFKANFESFKVCLCGVFVPIENFDHMKTSPLLVKDCKYLPIRGTYGQ